MPPNHLILSHPLFLLPSNFPSIRVFSNESVLRIRWPKYWSFSFNVNPSIEYSDLIFFRIDWFDLLAVQGTLKNILPQSPKVCFIHLCLFFCFAYRAIITIFLNSIYMCQYTVMVFIFLASVGEGEGGMFQENSIKTCILSRVKQITRPGWMHEASARTWCTGKTQRDLVEREVGGGIEKGNTCISMADSCQCMTKTTTIL